MQSFKGLDAGDLGPRASSGTRVKDPARDKLKLLRARPKPRGVPRVHHWDSCDGL